MRPSQVKNSPGLRAVEADPRGTNRVPMERKVILKFHDFGGFSIEYSANVSTSGMFIKTTSPKPVGSIFIFEVWLGDEDKLVHGLGEVVWIRDREEAPDRPAGMGISYLKLDDKSRAAIARVVKQQGAAIDEGSHPPGEAEDDYVTASLRAVPSDERSSGELLMLDEQELQLHDPLGPRVESGFLARPLRATAAPRRSRTALWLLLVLMVAASFGALWYAGWLPVESWLEALR
jgi:uncharacterized protein (TIGR02266 family)